MNKCKKKKSQNKIIHSSMRQQPMRQKTPPNIKVVFDSVSKTGCSLQLSENTEKAIVTYIC